MADQIVEPARTRQPWDRRPDESKRAFDAFVLYRDSPDRRLANVAKALVPPRSTARHWPLGFEAPVAIESKRLGLLR